MMRNFYKKAECRIGLNEDISSDPLKWALDKLNNIIGLFWSGLKRTELFEKRDLNSTIDVRSIYAPAMSTVFDIDFKKIKNEVFCGENL